MSLEAIITTLAPYRVTVTSAKLGSEQIVIMSRSRNDAAVQAINLLFSDADDCMAADFRIEAELFQLNEQAQAKAA